MKVTSFLHTRGTRFALLLVALACSGCGREEPRRPPNIVILLADDLGPSDVSWLGGTITTPHLDALAGEGARLQQAYASAPVCNPSRAGLLSGRYQQRWGQELNYQQDPPVGSIHCALPRSQPTIAEVLKEAGYATGAIGKWQMTMEPGFAPRARGFDYFFGHDRAVDYVDTEAEDLRVVHEPRRKRRTRFLQNEGPAEVEGLLTEAYAREASAFIERHKDQPFLLYASFFAPHAPLQTTQKYYDRHPQLPHERRVFAGMVAALDDGIGEILRTLADCNLDEDTLVVFLSDNGREYGFDVEGFDDHSLTGFKGTLYEGGVRIPMLARWKGRIPKGVALEHPVSSLDVFPTALAAAGLNPSVHDLDGVNLLPYLTGEATDRPHDFLFWRSGSNAAVLWMNWKLHEAADGRRRLFDLSVDAIESRDLALEFPGVVAQMQAELDSWKAGLRPPPVAMQTLTTRFHGESIPWDM